MVERKIEGKITKVKEEKVAARREDGQGNVEPQNEPADEPADESMDEFAVAPDPAIPKPPDPSTKEVPEAELHKLDAQLRLDLDTANATYDTNVATAEAGFVTAQGTWDTAENANKSAETEANATAQNTVQTAVLTYYTSMADATTPCPEKYPTPLEEIIFWDTLYGTVAEANATLETTLGTEQNTLEIAKGTFEGAKLTRDHALESATYTKKQGEYAAWMAYWTSIQTIVESGS